ncbi:hypothetical protein N9R54_03080 [Pelobium sp.]|nr:hypothetical protein [Pelobium sp.]MDA9555200.1 hypothetical protein [Pelobium sp.]
MKKLFSQFRLKSGLRSLRQEIKKMSRKNQSVSLDDAQTIGILVTIQNEQQLNEVEAIANSLKVNDKKVRLLGFLTNKTLKVNANSHIELISEEDIAWNYIPKKEKIINFVNNEFDILINLCTEICFPLMYVTALSKSLFKVGAYNPNQVAIFDFMIETQQQSISGFSSELKHYLDKIK